MSVQQINGHEQIMAATVTDAEVAAANKDGLAATVSLRTLGTGSQQACAGNDSRLSDSRSPTGSAGGDLGSTYPNPTVTGLGGNALPSNIANGFLKRNSGNTGWEEVAYGSASDTVCQGNDSRLSDSRTPTGSAGGDLSGSYPNPSVGGLGGNALPSNVANGFLKRNSGNTGWEEVAYGSAADTVCQGNDSRLSDSRTPTGTAGGDLTGTYPNPTLGTAGTAGTYTKVTTDTKGRVTSGTTLSASDLPGGEWISAGSILKKSPTADYTITSSYAIPNSCSVTLVSGVTYLIWAQVRAQIQFASAGTFGAILARLFDGTSQIEISSVVCSSTVFGSAGAQDFTNHVGPFQYKASGTITLSLQVEYVLVGGSITTANLTAANTTLYALPIG